ncbi:hypothetical protein EFQ99_32035 [Rhizobium vallis]|uniref:Uncharacterized protein n=1 Tax=Rhizobium vallis TaxID=634290 RepID=A0A3S0QKV4_9HYPH|nr:hypothetical protein EFQ99_32035 [Rhizobium vallis]
MRFTTSGQPITADTVPYFPGTLPAATGSTTMRFLAVIMTGLALMDSWSPAACFFAAPSYR